MNFLRPIVICICVALLVAPLSAGVRGFGRGSGGKSGVLAQQSVDTAPQQKGWANERQRQQALALGYGDTRADADLRAMALGQTSNTYPHGRASSVLETPDQIALTANQYEADCDEYIENNGLVSGGCADLQRDVFAAIKADTDHALRYGYLSHAARGVALALGYGDSCTDSDLFNAAQGNSSSSCSASLSVPQQADCALFITTQTLNGNYSPAPSGCRELEKIDYIAFTQWNN